MNHTPSHHTPFIRADDITKKFSMGSADIFAVRNLRLTVHKGEFLCICGPSGSGKTTLLYILGCLMQPTEGALYYDQTDITKLTTLELARFRRRQIAFIFQSFYLLNYLTALENVELPLIYQRFSKHKRAELANSALARVGLASRMQHLPSQLSGGEQQRVAIARALVSEPEVIYADEITGNLDTTTGMETIQLLQTLNKEKGLTIILVTHDAHIAEQADRRVYLQDGIVVGGNERC